MKCPQCNVNLTMSERAGVEIDYCPECRGVWLDRGELDKIIERSALGVPPAARSQMIPNFRQDKSYKKKKSDSFLSDLFDF